jgi:hypothetical protein
MFQQMCYEIEDRMLYLKDVPEKKTEAGSCTIGLR